MATTKRCGRLNAHDSHEWTEEVPVQGSHEYDPAILRIAREYRFCEGVPHDRSVEGLTEALAIVGYRDLTNLSFELVTREQIPTKFEFADLLPGDSKATITVVEGDDRWAVVEIRILARKPFIAREIEDGR